MRTSEVLNKAADEIQARGWMSGSGWQGDGSGPVCVEGAIAAAMGVVGGVGFRCDAYFAVRDYLGDLPPWIWNDNLKFKGGNSSLGWLVEGDWSASVEAAANLAIEALRACAVIEQARESEHAEVAS